MFDVKDDAKGEYRRVEVLVGPGRRRRWSAEEKARVVEESLVPGARVSEGARRWQVCSQQVFGWRRVARQHTTTGRPVPHLERHLRDVVAAVGVVFMGHWAIRTRKG